MAELRLTWAEFREAALERLSDKYPQIALNKDDNTRFVLTNTYEGEGDCYSMPEFVYVRLENGAAPPTEGRER